MDPTPAINTLSQKQVNMRHSRERFWQIVFPMAIVLLLAIALAVCLIAFAGAEGVRLGQFGAIAAIVIIIPALAGFLIFLALSVGMIYLLARLDGKVPELAGQLLTWLSIGKNKVDKISDNMAEPLLLFKQFGAQTIQIFNSFKKRFN